MKLIILFIQILVLNLIKKFNNLIIVRTTSKAWGLAGLGIGYILSSKKLIEEMQNQTYV